MCVCMLCSSSVHFIQNTANLFSSISIYPGPSNVTSPKPTKTNQEKKKTRFTKYLAVINDIQLFKKVQKKKKETHTKKLKIKKQFLSTLIKYLNPQNS